jgi:Ca-activated chloride channel family protein
MSFLEPWWLALAPALLALLVWARRRPAKGAPVVYSDVRLLAAGAGTGRARFTWLPRALWIVSALLLIVALARPQQRNVRREVIGTGIDIVLALDMSSTMTAKDFAPDRFTAAKAVIARFVASRSTDRIGLVVFAARAYTQVPLTFDYHAVAQMLDALRVGQIDDGTAIGMGMVEALNRLKVSDAKSKVIILLTDGVNNCGRVDPETAGEIAKQKGVRVYTIGMGLQKGAERSLLEQALGMSSQAPMNTDLLMRIAEQTGGRYFEAASLEDLSSIYATIGTLEKSEVKLNEFVTVKEWFPRVLLAAFAFLFAGWLLELTWLRRLP